MLSSKSVSGLSIQLIDKDEYNKEVAEKMSRVTVITGGTSGIGRGIVEKILANSEQDDLILPPTHTMRIRQTTSGTV